MHDEKIINLIKLCMHKLETFIYNIYIKYNIRIQNFINYFVKFSGPKALYP